MQKLWVCNNDKSTKLRPKITAQFSKEAGVSSFQLSMTLNNGFADLLVD